MQRRAGSWSNSWRVRDPVARDVPPAVRDWLVTNGCDATERHVRRSLDALGVVAEPETLTRLVAQLTADLVGAGALQPLLDLPGVTDVLVNGPGSVWVDTGTGLPGLRDLLRGRGGGAGLGAADGRPGRTPVG